MKKIMKWMHRGGALLLIAAMLFTQSGIVSLAEETGLCDHYRISRGSGPVGRQW